MLGLIPHITLSFSSIDSLVTFCVPVRSELEFASVAWNSVTLTDSSKIEGVQRKFANMYYNIRVFFVKFVRQ
jgi:hypothetical protein